MPKQFFDISEVHGTVQKPVIDSVVDNILANTGLDDKHVYYVNEVYGGVKQAGSTVGDKTDDTFGTEERIEVEVEHEREPLTRFDRAVGYNRSRPFFNDGRSTVLIPNYVMYNASVVLRRRASSKSTIVEWANHIQRKLDMGANSFTTHADYYYLIPNEALVLLKDIYDAQYKGASAPETLQQYYQRGFDDNVTVVTNIASNGGAYVVREKQARITCRINTDGPVPRRGDKRTTWETEFSFQFTYSCPESVEAVYPIIINNTLLPRQWWVARDAPGLTPILGEVDWVTEALDSISQYEWLTLPAYIPPCDLPELVKPSTHAKDIDLAVIHLTLDHNEEPPYLLFNLGQMGEYGLSQPLIDYIVDSYRDNPIGQDSVFKINLFENNGLVLRDMIAIDEELNVYFNNQVKYTSVYRVIITVEMGWKHISTKAFEVLRNHPIFVGQAVSIAIPEYRIDNIGGGKVNAPTLDDICDRLADIDSVPHNYGSSLNNLRRPINILNGTLVSHRS